MTDKHAQTGWGGEPLVMCINGPRAGAWYTLTFWQAARAAAAHDGETTHTGRTLGYVRTGQKQPSRINPEVEAHILAWSPDTAAAAS